MAAWAAHHHDQAPPAEPERALHLSPVGDRWALDGTLDQESGQLVAAALRVATSPDTEGEPARTPATRRADALSDICQFFLNHQTHVPEGRHRPHLNIIINQTDLHDGRPGRYADGHPAGHLSVQTMVCDSIIHRLIHQGRSTILDYGTATRTAPAALYNALVIRDRHCRFAGCDRPAHWCDSHHVTHYSHGGPTAISGLVLLCRRHHRRLHQPGWTAHATTRRHPPRHRPHRNHPHHPPAPNPRPRPPPRPDNSGRESLHRHRPAG